MLQVIAVEILLPNLFNESTALGAICVLILNLVWIIAKTYLAKKKGDDKHKVDATDHAATIMFKVIDELQDVNNQLVKANTELRQELITKVAELIAENAEYKTKLDYIENQSKFIVSTVKDIKNNGNGNGHSEHKS